MTTELANDVTGAPPVGISSWLGRIVCGDNTEVLSGFPDACIDLVVTSPPYDDLRTYGGHSWNFETLAAQLVRVLKPGGVIVWVVGDKTEDGSESLSSMKQAIHFKEACGLKVWDTMIWHKPNPAPGDGKFRYHQAWEYVFVMTKGQPKTCNMIRDVPASMGGRTEVIGYDRRRDQANTKTERKPFLRPELGFRSNVWTVAKSPAAEDAIAKDGHPAIFPLRLAKDHVASWSNPGDVVLDPFTGSGTTLKAAKELERLWCGIEINPEYCAIAEARLSQGVLQLETCAMRPNIDYPTGPDIEKSPPVS